MRVLRRIRQNGYAGSLAARIAAPTPMTVDLAARLIVGRRGIPNLAVARARAVEIPKLVRAAGLTRQYLAKIDNGHIRSVHRFPSGRNWPSNQRWELSHLNRATGAGRKPACYWIRNAEQLRRHRMQVLASGGLRAAFRGAWIAAAIELPVATIEEIVAVRRGEKDWKRAVGNGSVKVGAAAIGGGIGASVGFAACSMGAATALASAAPILAILAVGHFGGRIVQLRSRPIRSMAVRRRLGAVPLPSTPAERQRTRIYR